MAKPNATSSTGAPALTVAEFAKLIGGGINAGHVLRAIRRGRIIARADGHIDPSTQLVRWTETVRQNSGRPVGRPRKRLAEETVSPLGSERTSVGKHAA